MGKRSQAGFLDPKEAGRGSPHQDRVGGGSYTFVARDGQARWTGVRIGRQAEASGLTGPSMWLGWGAFSQRSVLSLLPGICEDPSVRDLLASGERRGSSSWPWGSAYRC